MSLLRTWDSLGSREQLVILWFEKGQCASSPLPFGCLDVPPAPPPPVEACGKQTLSPHCYGAEDQRKCHLPKPVCRLGAGHT